MQEFDLTKGSDGKELSVELGFDDSWPKYWTCITGGVLNRRLEMRDGELVMSVLTLFVVHHLTQSLSQYGLPGVLGGLSNVDCCLDLFWVAKCDLAWKAMSAKSASGSVAQ